MKFMTLGVAKIVVRRCSLSRDAYLHEELSTKIPERTGPIMAETPHIALIIP